MSTLIQSIAGIQAALRRNKKETGDTQRVVDEQKAPEKRLQALEAEQRALEEALAAAEAKEQQARARLVDCDYWITRLEPYEVVFSGTAPGLSMLADDAMAGRLPGLDPYRFAGAAAACREGLDLLKSQ